MITLALGKGYTAAFISEEDAYLTNMHWTPSIVKSKYIYGICRAYHPEEAKHLSQSILLQRAVASRMLSRSITARERCYFLDEDTLNCTRNNLLVLEKSIIFQGGAIIEKVGRLQNIISVDLQDYTLLKDTSWHIHTIRNHVIARSTHDGEALHRKVMERVTGQPIDDRCIGCRDGNFLNARRENLFVI